MKIVIDDKIPYLHGQVERLFDEVVSLPGAAIGPADVRDADALNADAIFSEATDTTGVGLAVMNRLERAAGFHIVEA